MKNEFEIIEHSHIKYLNVFLVNMNYRSPHLHREFELILVLHGDVTIKIKQEIYNLSSGSSVIFNPNQPHEIKSDNNSSLILCVQISPKFCSDYFPNMSNLVFDTFNIRQNASNDTYKYIQSLTLKLGYFYYKKRNGYEFSCMSIINQLFSIFLDILPYHIISDEEKRFNQIKIERLNRILNYIDENYMYKLKLSHIAERENLSVSYLSHFIKDNLNESFQEYINNHRFNQAKKLLLTTDMKLIDICMECGFSDYRYLYKVFKENYNCTPKEYVKLYGQVPLKMKTHSNESCENFYTSKNTLNILDKYIINDDFIMDDWVNSLV